MPVIIKGFFKAVRDFLVKEGSICFDKTKLHHRLNKNAFFCHLSHLVKRSHLVCLVDSVAPMFGLLKIVDSLASLFVPTSI